MSTKAWVGVIKFTSSYVHKINTAQSNPLHRWADKKRKKFWSHPLSFFKNIPEKRNVDIGALKAAKYFSKRVSKSCDCLLVF